MSEQPDMNPQQAIQLFQQKLGNLELTVQALLNVLEDKDVVDQDTINEKAQEIVQEIQDQQQGNPLEDEE